MTVFREPRKGIIPLAPSPDASTTHDTTRFVYTPTKERGVPCAHLDRKKKERKNIIKKKKRGGMRMTLDGWREIKKKGGVEICGQTGTVQSKMHLKEKKKENPPHLRLKVPVWVIRISRSGIRLRRNHSLHAPALRPPAIPTPRRAHLRYPSWPVVRALRLTRREQYRRPRFTSASNSSYCSTISSWPSSEHRRWSCWGTAALWHREGSWVSALGRPIPRRPGLRRPPTSYVKS